ncbi:MAG: hypothetical protein GF320_05710 [Armatimonadia bacterium]|nr:hypothetical protein [Armatimonadia bacterium]
MAEKIVLIGAGSAVFTRGLVADLILRGEEAQLALVDIDPRALRIAEGLARKMIESRSAPIELAASTNRREVLEGATAVICMVGVGGRRAWERDVFIPRKYGIYQPVGDTVMPGGTSRALRMVPVMVDIAVDVADLAPAALFFNYGNPMSAVCRGVRKALEVEVVGLCHGVHHVLGQLAELLGVHRTGLSWDASGINHLTWLTGLWHEGRDLWPEMLARIPGRGEPAPFDPFCWDLFRLLGAYPAVGDRHVTEFFAPLFPSGRYGERTLGVDAFSFEETIRGGDEGYAAMEADALGPQPLPPEYWDRISGEHEQVMDIIHAIRKDTGERFSVNLPNGGQAPNLPPDAVIECPAVATAGGLRPVGQPPLPEGAAGTLATRFQWVETVVDAALEGSREKFVQALILDGACPSLRVAEDMADELLTAHSEHLPRFA